MTHPKLFQATASNPGAVALLCLWSEGAVELACRLTGRAAIPPARAVLARFESIDEGLVQRLSTPAGEMVMLMPHAGPRVVQRLVERLIDLGAVYEPAPDPRALFPEAATALEAWMLWVMAGAASPRAVPALLAQPARWAHAAASGRIADPAWRARVLERSAVMDRLLVPPTVVVAGRPNVGKSTLTNRLSGRESSLVADGPGTTRDWVGTTVVVDGVLVRWIDTPGVRETSDPIEARAIQIARSVIQAADVLVSMADPSDPGWLDGPSLAGRAGDVYVMNKVDRASGLTANEGDGTRDRPVLLSAQTGQAVDRLLELVGRRLGLGDAQWDADCWAFCAPIREMLDAGRADELRRWIGV